MRPYIMMLFSLAFVGSVPSLATQRDVPGQYPSINMALQSALTGDTVLVHPNVYNEMIVFPATNCCLFGEYVLTGDTNAISNTIIDASSFSDQDTAAVLVFLHGNTSSTRVAGFTITGGHGVVDYSGYHVGGALYIQNSHPTIEWNHFTGNSAHAYSTAVFEGSHSTVSHNTFRDNCAFTRFFEVGYNAITGQTFTFEWNDVTGHYGCDGADSSYLADDCVFAIQADLTVRFNRFHDYTGFQTVGVELFSSLGHVYGNIFEGLSTYPDGTVVDVAYEGNTWIFDNVFRDCQFSHGVVIGLVRSNTWGTSRIQRNWLENIQSGDFGPSCIFAQHPNLQIEENVFLNCEGITGAIQTSQSYGEGCIGSVERNHFFGNRANAPSGYAFGANFSTYGSGPQCSVHQNWFEASHGLSVHFDEIDALPRDVSNNYWGDPSGPYHPELNPTGQGDTLVGDVIISPWLTEPPDESSGPSPSIFAPAHWLLETPYPNPFNAETHFRLRSDQFGIFEAVVYDIQAREVATIWRGLVARDSYAEFSWNGSDGRGRACASGLYFVSARPKSGEFRTPQTAKVILLR